MDPSSMSRRADYIERVRALASLITEQAERSERERQLSPQIVEAFHKAGLFRILLPTRLSGGELTLPDALRVIEEVSRIDGSAGWNLAICAGSALFGSFISKDGFER